MRVVILMRAAAVVCLGADIRRRTVDSQRKPAAGGSSGEGCAKAGAMRRCGADQAWEELGAITERYRKTEAPYC